MQKLYTECLGIANIEKAIHTVLSHEGAKTAGVDGISKSSSITHERIIKEIKLRLRRYKPVQSRKVQIPKSNGGFREITIINLFDRMAQQAVYQIIAPLIEGQMSKNSYGFRKSIGAKIPVCHLADMLLNSKDIFTVELDFKKCFDNIPLDKAIACLKDMGIRNFQLLRTIKHLMWTSKEYTGVGLSQGTILGPLLANCYLTKLDKFIEQTFETDKTNAHYTRDYNAHANNWIEWNLQRGKKIRCRYFRYADDTFIICHNQVEQEFITKTISEFVENNLDIELNKEKSQFRHNEIHFLGFKIIKNKRSIWILMDNPKEYTDVLKRFKFNTNEQCQAFMKWFRGVLNYFDIVNDMSDFLDKVALKLYRRSRDSAIRKIENTYRYGSGKNEKIIDIYALRKASRTSYKEYLVSNRWLTRRELLIYRYGDKSISGTSQYLWGLWTLQKGKDAVTKEELDPFDCQIHHVKPVSKGGTNEIDNLILISSKTHYLIHHGENFGKRFEKYQKHLK